MKRVDYILMYGALWLLMLDGDSLITLDVIKVAFTVLFCHHIPLIRLITLWVWLFYVYFFVTSMNLGFVDRFLFKLM